jgi:hypothetical protein
MTRLDSQRPPGMQSAGDDSVDLVRWLQEVARRGGRTITQSPPELIPDSSESSEDVLRYLEQLTGRELRSREAIKVYLKELARDEIQRTRVATGNRIVREALLLGLLSVAYLHYYYWDVSLQIASLARIHVFVPVIEDRDLGRAGSRST